MVTIIGSFHVTVNAWFPQYRYTSVPSRQVGSGEWVIEVYRPDMTPQRCEILHVGGLELEEPVLLDADYIIFREFI